MPDSDEVRVAVESILKEIKSAENVSKGSGIVGGLSLGVLAFVVVWVWNLRGEVLTNEDLDLRMKPLVMSQENMAEGMKEVRADLRFMREHPVPASLLSAMEVMREDIRGLHKLHEGK